MRRLAPLLLAALTGALLAPASASGAAFDKFVSCDKQPLRRSHVCHRDVARVTNVYAAFRSNQADVTWKPCVRTPGGSVSCAPPQTARRGILYRIRFSSTGLGRFTFFWFVKGERLGRWVVRFRP